VRARRRAALAAFAAFAATSAACTLLVQFEDVPAGVDASLPPLVDGGPGDAGADARDATDIDLSDARPCLRADGSALSNGWYCAGNGTGYWPGAKDTLFRCTNGKYEATLCDGGCVFFRTGVPDRCDPCPGRKDGKYCGPEVGWDSAARDEDLTKFLIECIQGDLAAGAQRCTNSCVVATHTCN